MSWVVRVPLVLVGLVAIFGGLGAWAIEDQYGSGLNFTVEQDALGGVSRVYEEDEQDDAGDRDPVFEGSPREAQEYMERRRAAGESFLVGGVVITVGAVLVILGSFPFRGKDRSGKARASS